MYRLDIGGMGKLSFISVLVILQLSAQHSQVGSSKNRFDEAV